MPVGRGILAEGEDIDGPTPTISWSLIAEQAFTGFKSANASPTIVGAMQRGARYVVVDHKASEIVFDFRALILGMIAAGIEDGDSLPFGNTAAWLAAKLGERVSKERMTATLAQRTSPDDALGALSKGYKVVLSYSVRGLEADAVRFAQATVRREAFDARHLFAAALDNKEFHDLIGGLFGLSLGSQDIEALKRDLIARTLISPEPGETEAAWLKAFGLSQQPPSRRRAAAPPRRAADDAISPFDGDTPVADDTDVLGTERDVEALMQLVCLDRVAPLAVAIFGDWGSGKSTFMAKLEQAVRAMSRPEDGRTAPAANEASAARFVHPIVQIRFNAWHFADANLWASLTAEFFDQLRAGGYDRSGQARHAQLVQRVNQHVHALSDSLSANREAMVRNGEVVLQAQKARDQAAKDAREASGKVFARTAMNLLSESYAAQKGHLAALGLGGADNKDKAADVIVGAAKDASSAFGSLGAVWGVLKGAGKRWWLTIPLVLAVVFGMAAWLAVAFWKPGAAWLDVVAPLVAGGVALAASLGKVLGPALAIARDVAKRGATLAGEIDAKNKATVAALLVKEVELKKALAEAQALEDAETASAKALARYVDPTGKANPPRLLRYVLEDDPDTKALEKDIGLIGRTRRLFQAVDTIAREVRDARREPGYAERPDADWETPERIIIYIDDLDRCHEDKVYEVLQAIHLLLAFDLFVVVVGVDVNWVQAALAKQFETGDAETDKLGEQQRNERAMHYLEKIFQIPFWLRPLAGGEGGTFQPYVRMLAGESVESSAARRVQTTTARRPHDEYPDVGEVAARLRLNAKRRGKTEDTSASPAAETTKAKEAERAKSRRKLQLTEAEIAFLGSPEIAALAATAPRGVKRLVNVYRIARARRGQEDGEAVLGGSGRPPEYPLIALMAAVETGQRPLVADWFLDRLRSGQPGSVESLISPYAKRSPEQPETAEVDALYAACAAATRQRKVGFQAVELLAAARLVRRYSFNRYR